MILKLAFQTEMLTLIVWINSKIQKVKKKKIYPYNMCYRRRKSLSMLKNI